MTLSGGGGLGTLVQVGNQLVDRAYATDFVTAPTVIPASVSPATTRIYTVNVGSASGGTFTLSVDGVLSAAIAYNALAADVVTALGAVSATVTGNGSIADPWVIVFAVAPTSVSIDGSALTQAVINASAVLNSAAGIANVTVGSASGGTFVLSVDGVLTAPIAFNALAADIEAALGAGTATVTGSGSIADPWVIIFAASPLSFSIDGSGLTQSVIDTSASLNIATSTATVTVGSASGGNLYAHC